MKYIVASLLLLVLVKMSFVPKNVNGVEIRFIIGQSSTITPQASSSPTLTPTLTPTGSVTTTPSISKTPTDTPTPTDNAAVGSNLTLTPSPTLPPIPHIKEPVVSPFMQNTTDLIKSAYSPNPTGLINFIIPENLYSNANQYLLRAFLLLLSIIFIVFGIKLIDKSRIGPFLYVQKLFLSKKKPEEVTILNNL